MYCPDLSHIRKVLSEEHARAADDAAHKAADKVYRRRFAHTKDADAAECDSVNVYLRVLLHHVRKFGKSRDN
jgi:hypothetical protein